MADRLAIPVPDAQKKVAAWMVRVRNVADRPLPLLFVHGPVGAGKSVLVAEAARAANVRLVDIGSDDIDIDGTTGNEVPALRTKQSLEQWRAMVQMRSFAPQALVIDDAECVLARVARAKHDADDADVDSTHSANAETLMALAGYRTPLIIIAAETYNNTTLDELRRTKNVRVEHVFMPRPALSDVRGLLAREFPLVPTAACAEAAEAHAGDVRRARLALAVGASHGQEQGRLSAAHAPVFAVADALLGRAGNFAPTDAATRARLAAPYLRLLTTLVSSQYAAALPPDDVETLSYVADTIAETNDRGYSDTMRTDILTEHVTQCIRSAHVDSTTQPKYLSYATDTRGNLAPGAAELALALRHHQFATLAATDRFLNYTRDNESRSATAAMRVETGTRLARDRDVLDAAAALANLAVPESVTLRPFKETTEALAALNRGIRKRGAPVAWDAPPALRVVPPPTTVTPRSELTQSATWFRTPSPRAGSPV